MPFDHPKSLLHALCALSLASTTALAQDGAGKQAPRGAHHEPPEAAYTACDGLSEEDVCEVMLSDHSIDGLCVRGREDGRLFCRPERPQPPPLPPAAAEACREKAEGDACTMTGRDGDASPAGICVDGPEGLACRPPLPAPRE